MAYRIVATTFVVLSCIGSAAAEGSTSIIFTTLGRSRYAFDLFSVRVDDPDAAEVRLTDGRSVNYNGHFFSSSPALSSLLPADPDHLPFLYVSERNGSSNVFLGGAREGQDAATAGRRSALQVSGSRAPVPLLSPKRVSMKDRPSVVAGGDRIVYVSTHEDSGEARKSWAAVYSTHLGKGETVRLTPIGVADFSPAVSPSGEWTAVASSGERGWAGEIDDLKTGIYVFKTRDGSERRLVAEHGGWPVWGDETSIYFHRPGEDGWWSVYRANLQGEVSIERVTPPGVHAFTPGAAPGSPFIAVATRRPESEFRHIELFDLVTKTFVEITKRRSLETNHYNPFLSPDGTRLGYHRCRGAAGKSNKGLLLLENLHSPVPNVSLFRVDGSFPSFSPDGIRIAYAGFPGLYVANTDGSGRRRIFPGTAFATAWDPKRKGVVYTSVGPSFAGEFTEVDIASFQIHDDGSYTMKKLTRGGENNAFPSPSPDGKRVVFRSGRSGHKNLYIMDAEEGESAGPPARLTEGNWTDTMCNWSPDGDWIAFASDRERPGSGHFAIYFVRPDGSGLKKVFESGPGSNGRANHPWFSPDSKRIVFTSDHAAVSAEPIANPHHYQPYGDIFVARVDGTHLTRLTHNSYEDGTPSWGPRFLKPNDVEAPQGVSPCVFDDCHFLAKFPDKSYTPAVGPAATPCV